MCCTELTYLAHVHVFDVDSKKGVWQPRVARRVGEGTVDEGHRKQADEPVEALHVRQTQCVCARACSTVHGVQRTRRRKPINVSCGQMTPSPLRSQNTTCCWMTVRSEGASVCSPCGCSRSTTLFARGQPACELESHRRRAVTARTGVGDDLVEIFGHWAGFCDARWQARRNVVFCWSHVDDACMG